MAPLRYSYRPRFASLIDLAIRGSFFQKAASDASIAAGSKSGRPVFIIQTRTAVRIKTHARTETIPPPKLNPADRHYLRQIDWTAAEMKRNANTSGFRVH